MQELTKTQQSEIMDHVNGLRSSMTTSADAFKKAATHYYNAIKISPLARDVFSAEFPQVASATWSKFLRVAAGELDERLIFDATPAARALSYCDSDTQRYFVDNPVPISCGNGDTIMVQLDKMTSEQARQVFNRGAVRDVAEQRAWIETQKTRQHIVSKPAVDKANDVYVKGSVLHVGKLKLSRAELLRYLGQMEG